MISEQHMTEEKNMLQKFVYITGALDFLIGAGVWAGALTDQQPGQFVAYMTLGMFLMMAAACLMWASKDMENRAPVIFWQGLVRLVAVCSVIYGVPAGLAQPWEYSLVVFDGAVGLTYVIGMSRVTSRSPIELLQCKTAEVAEAT
jgi:uncharacterized membrane protein YiaA